MPESPTNSPSSSRTSSTSVRRAGVGGGGTGPRDPRAGRTLPRSAIVAALAGAQHGIVAFRQLRDRGISRSAIDRMMRSGHLHPLHRGVYVVGHALVTPKGRLMAAVLATGDGALISHVTASELHGLRDWGGTTIHVTSTRQGPTRAGITGHRTRSLLPGDATRVDGIPVTSVPRTLGDCGATGSPAALERLWRRAEQLDVLDAAACLRQLRSGRPGTGALRRLVASADDAAMSSITRSELEIVFLEVLLASGLPWPETNVRLPVGGATYEIDALWRDRRVAVELDGWRTHRDRRSFEEDRLRDERLTAAGLRPVRFTWRRIVGDPGGVASTLRSVLRA